jgi:hypothetical protein
MRHLNHLHIWRDVNRLLVATEEPVRQFPRHRKYKVSGDLRRQATTIYRLILGST